MRLRFCETQNTPLRAPRMGALHGPNVARHTGSASGRRRGRTGTPLWRPRPSAFRLDKMAEYESLPAPSRGQAMYGAYELGEHTRFESATAIRCGERQASPAFRRYAGA